MMRTSALESILMDFDVGFYYNGRVPIVQWFARPYDVRVDRGRENPIVRSRNTGGAVAG